MSRKATIFLAVMLIGFLFMFIAGKALASGIWYNYDVTVPPFHQTVTTNNETKQYNGQCAIHCDWVGGDYDLDVWLELADNTAVSGSKNINDGDTWWFNNTASAGQNVHMTFRSGLTDRVHIEAVGKWSPDSPTL